jgi:hypothetical protein
VPLKYFKSFNYDYQKNYLIIEEIGDVPNIYPAIESQLKNTYCSLLKIRSLAKKNAGRSAAIKNINAFMEWMINDLDIIRGAEYQLALNIFGGNTTFWKMIGLDSKGIDAKKKLNGTSWDLFHGKNVSNRFRLFQMFGRNFMPYFITSDSNLFNILGKMSLTVVKDGGENLVSSFISNSGFAYPNYDESFLDEHNERMMNIFIDRRNKKYEFDEQKVNRLITELEIENQIYNL